MTFRLLTRRFLPLALLAAIPIAAVGFAESASSTTQPAAGVAKAANLHDTMERMEDTFKAIVKQMDDATQDASTLSLMGELQVATATAKNLPPDDVGELTGDAKAKAIAEYRNRMIALLRTQLELEEAILKNDRPAAKAAVASLKQQREEGHKAYDVDDHHH